jgi:hypothetical protein
MHGNAVALVHMVALVQKWKNTNHTRTLRRICIKPVPNISSRIHLWKKETA